MPRHMTPEAKWELLLRTLSTNEDISVLSVNENRVEFTARTPETITALRAILDDADLLRERVVHAIPRNVGVEGVTAGASSAGAGGVSAGAAAAAHHLDPRSKKLGAVLGYDARKVLESIATRYLICEKAGVDLEALDNSLDLKAATWQIIAENRIALKEALTKIEYLQSALGNPAQLAKILLDEDLPINHEDDNGNITAFGSEVLKVTQNSNTNATVTFNYGMLLQAIQTESHDHHHAPVIAARTDASGQIVYSIEGLIEYLPEVLQPAIVFHPEGHDGALVPVMANSHHHEEAAAGGAAATSQVPFIHLVIDTSGSMVGSFGTYMSKINSVIQKITESHHQWKIRITAFSDEATTQEFSSTSSESLRAITSFTNSLFADGGTALNNTLVSSIDQINAERAINPLATLIVFTDGEDTGPYNNPSKSASDVILASSALIEANLQFGMFSLGFGMCYNKGFFTDLAERGGFTHIDLDDVGGIDELHQYIGSLGMQRSLFEFLTEAGVFLRAQVAEGEIAVAAGTVREGDIVRHEGTEYTVGTEAREVYEAPDANAWLNAIIGLLSLVNHDV